MGCDIHAYVEAKTEYGWDLISRLHINRSYGFFGILAGVRQPALKMFEPRGVPDDLSLFTKLEHRDWQGDAHNESWLTAEEFRTAIQRRIDIAPNLTPDLIACKGTLDALVNANIDSRVVFWFDN